MQSGIWQFNLKMWIKKWWANDKLVYAWGGIEETKMDRKPEWVNEVVGEVFLLFLINQKNCKVACWQRRILSLNGILERQLLMIYYIKPPFSFIQLGLLLGLNGPSALSPLILRLFLNLINNFLKFTKNWRH